MTGIHWDREVVHGSFRWARRPNASRVVWIGQAQPVNARPGDWWDDQRVTLRQVIAWRFRRLLGRFT